jgi:phage head maturation protease
MLKLAVREPYGSAEHGLRITGYAMKNNNYCSPSNTKYRENRIDKLLVYHAKRVLLLYNHGTARVKTIK